MYLSRFHRRTLMVGAMLGVAGLAAVPMLAQNNVIISPTLIQLSRAGKPIAGVNKVIAPVKGQLTVSGLQAHIAKLLAPDPKMSPREIRQERRERAEEFRAKMIKSSGKRTSEEEEEGESNAIVEGALLYRLQQRAYPNDRVDIAAIRSAMEHRDRMQPARAADAVDALFNGQNNAPNAAQGKALSQAVVKAGGIGNDQSATGGASSPGGSSGGADTGTGTTSSGPGTGGGTDIGVLPLASSGRWEFLGQKNGITGQPNRGAGRINVITYDPTNASTVYCGAAEGGVWKSTDGGTTWTPKTDDQFSLAISSIAVDYQNSNNVYAGTGDYDGGTTGNGAGYPFGILKSTDGGTTWANVGSELGNVAIRKIQIDPVSPSKLFATAGYNGLYLSTDSGLTWTNVLKTKGSFSNVIYDANHQEIYACAEYDGFYHSTDGGNTWSVLPGAPTLTGRGDIAPSPRRQVLYVVNAGAKNVQKRDFDTSGNLTWQTTMFPAPTPNTLFDQAFYDIYIAADNSDRIYVGLISEFESTDGGATWFNPSQGHPDQHAIAFNPTNPNQVLLGNDGGVYRITNGGTAASLNATLGITEYYFGAYHPTNPLGLIGGTQDNGTAQTNDGAAFKDVSGGDGGGTDINQQAGGTQYSSVYNLKIGGPLSPAIYPINRTDDAWATPARSIALDTGDDITPFLATIKCNLANPNLVYLGTNYLAQYNAVTDKWTKLPQRLSTSTYVLSIGTSPVDANTVYAGLLDGNLFYSTNGGLTFKNIKANLPNRAITDIEVSPTNPQKLYVTVSGTGSSHVFRCDNAAAPSWRDISGAAQDVKLPDIPTNAFALVPGTGEQQMYVGTDIGVFNSVDGGQSWQNATVPLGLPNAMISDLTANPNTGYLMASTFGRGQWRLPLDTSVPGSPVLTITPSLQGYRGDKTRLSVTVIVSVNGQTLSTRTGKLTAAGTFTTRIAKAGTYDVYVKITGFLNKRYKSFRIGAQNTFTGVFYNGDVNGDNVIDATDLTLVQAKLGQHIVGLPDVDGDGSVTSADVTLVRGNLGKVGD